MTDDNDSGAAAVVPAKVVGAVATEGQVQLKAVVAPAAPRMGLSGVAKATGIGRGRLRAIMNGDASPTALETVDLEHVTGIPRDAWTRRVNGV